MPRKLTILLDDEVYERLHAAAGRRRVGRYVEQLVRDRLHDELDSAYAAMAREEERERQAFDWAEATLEDVSDETR